MQKNMQKRRMKSVKTRTLHTVWGADIDSETMTLARLCGAIDRPLTDENLADCDLLLLALAPRSVVRWVQEHAERIDRKTVVIDFCARHR